MGLPRDIRLNGSDWDMTGGDLVFTSDLEAIAQHIRMRLSLLQGEWYLDESQGVPLFDSVLVKNPNMNAIRRIYRETIEQTPGVSSVSDLTITFDSKARTATITFSAVCDLGLVSDTVTVGVAA